MAEREVTRFETVEKTETLKVCDSCGTDETQIPEDSGEFRTVLENVQVTAQNEVSQDLLIQKERVRPNGIAGRSHRVRIFGESHDLCPICYGATIGFDD